MFSRWPVRSSVIVNLKDGTSFRGVLFQKKGPLLELVNASIHFAAGGVHPMDGTIVVERSNVSFIQVLTTVAPATSREAG